MGLKRILGLAAAGGVGYLAWQVWKEMEKQPARSAPDGDGARSPTSTYATPPPTPPSGSTTAVTDLGPPSPDQVPGYKIRFNAALDDGRFEDAAHIVGLLRAAGEEAWADNAERMIEDRRRRS